MGSGLGCPPVRDAASEEEERRPPPFFEGGRGRKRKGRGNKNGGAVSRMFRKENLRVLQLFSSV